ncbi:hypothetical protein O0I10_007772 [Lichtheimia ornata]|uniref:AP-3 complex subunit delta n=1 Tax=Lichtheimia ornata TaxID=688661 RepID=A0AAD7XTI9_9FUNG|nr:uncharacterized protein O0I10_007772 [Lichtheimia ornata]KAJ8656449.1 hypothetical protein O0I10_007772 [Lichtheimia ornata]
MFEKSLTDLIRGIRANKKNEQKYIQVCLQEIRNEVKSNDVDVKGVAIAKLTYLQMLGYDMSWASFHVVEVMSSPKLVHKRAGYLAASQSFQQDTDVLMLTTNLIKKDLASPSPLDIGIAINGLSHIVTPDLARDLCQDLVSMLNHSRPYIRKKVVLVLYKVFLRFPEALRLSFPRLREKLEDPDPSVVSATVSVICELARKNPRNYLSLAPQLFRLLTTSSNNWMLIKIIKMFASLTPLEPRLIKKLLPPLISLIQTTPAMSLLYECIHTVITGGFLEAAGDSGNTLAATCVNRLRQFLEDPDQNLKYVGLLAMSRLRSTHPKLIAENKDIILECIDDQDFSIRLRALDLVVGMASKKTLVDIVKRLIAHLVPPEQNDNAVSIHEAPTVLDPIYRTDIINRIIYICSQHQYRNITNFEWYITVLVGMAYVSGVNVGEVLTTQLMDVAVRVKSVRPFAVKQMFNLLSDKQLLRTARKRDSNVEVLSAAAWICGEYCSYLDSVPATLECLLTPYMLDLPVSVQSIYVHTIIKIYGFWVHELADEWNGELQQEFLKVTEVMRSKISIFEGSTDLEVKERGYNARAIFDLVLRSVPQEEIGIESLSLLQGFSRLFSLYELNPVAPKAQRKVPIPEGLDLDQYINEPLPDLVSDTDSEDAASSFDHVVPTTHTKKKKSKKNGVDYDDEDVEKRRALRLEAIKHDPYYIASDKPKKNEDKLLDVEDIDSIPVVKLPMDDFDESKKHRKKKSKKSRKARMPLPAPPVYAPEEMPDNAVQSDQEEDNNTRRNANDHATSSPIREGRRDIFAYDDTVLNSVDLSVPVGEEEQLPQMTAYLTPEEVRRQEEVKMRTERKQSRKQASSRQRTSDDTQKKKKKKKKSSKKPSKAAKQEEMDPSHTAADLPSATEIMNQEEMTKTHVLYEDDAIVLSYNVVLDTEKEGDDPMIRVKFSVSNKSKESTVSNLCISSPQSLDFRPVDNTTSESPSIGDEHELSFEETLNITGRFVMLGDMRRDLHISCDLQYRAEDSSMVTTSDLHIPIRPSVFLVVNQPGIDPSQFAALLENHGEQFDYRDTAHLNIQNTKDTSTDQAPIELLGDISRSIRLQVVEVVPGAASLYGKSVTDVQVAGLLKYTIPSATEDNTISVTIDLKCTDDGFLEALIDEISSLEVNY